MPTSLSVVWGTASSRPLVTCTMFIVNWLKRWSSSEEALTSLASPNSSPFPVFAVLLLPVSSSWSLNRCVVSTSSLFILQRSSSTLGTLRGRLFSPLGVLVLSTLSLHSQRFGQSTRLDAVTFCCLPSPTWHGRYLQLGSVSSSRVATLRKFPSLHFLSSFLLVSRCPCTSFLLGYWTPLSWS